tara:strand:- start:2434 stop:3042 length:609 start_codon:yes stop_codon:yes gene_type:complete
MKIKICGLNPTRDVQLCIDLKVNFLGFIFYDKSPRNLKISDLDILKNYNKEKSSFVAVTVNPSDQLIKNLKTKKLDYIQLHGSESNRRIKEIKKNFELKIIKTIKVKTLQDINKYEKFNNADIILFDTPGMEKSIKFPKNLLKELPKGERFALAGGVSIDSVKNLAKLGIKFFDLSSSVESNIGYKDHNKIKAFMRKINDEN